MPMRIAGAAGSTSQRLKRAFAIVLSRAKNPAVISAAPEMGPIRVFPKMVVFSFDVCADRRSPQGPPPENEWLLRARHLDRNRRIGEFHGAAPQVMGLWRRAPRKLPCIVE